MFTSALRSAEAETSSAAALTGVEEGIDAVAGAETEAGAGTDAIVFFFWVEVADGEAAVAALTLGEGGRGNEMIGREKSDVSKNSAEVVAVFTAGADSIARLSKKPEAKIPTKSIAAMPKYGSKRFIRIR